MTPRPSCYWCDSDATRMCDHGLGGCSGYPCGAFVCEAHSTRRASIDVCPLHVGAAPGKAPSSYEDAQRMRREIRALAARSRFEVVSGGAARVRRYEWTRDIELDGGITLVDDDGYDG